jgi:hypothetical protein
MWSLASVVEDDGKWITCLFSQFKVLLGLLKGTRQGINGKEEDVWGSIAWSLLCMLPVLRISTYTCTYVRENEMRVSALDVMNTLSLNGI